MAKAGHFRGLLFTVKATSVSSQLASFVELELKTPPQKTWILSRGVGVQGLVRTGHLLLAVNFENFWWICKVEPEDRDFSLPALTIHIVLLGEVIICKLVEKKF